MECLESLKHVNYDFYDIYLVDNDSKKESVDYILNYLENDSYYSHSLVLKNQLYNYVKSDDVDILFIINDENSGFAGGNNVALNYILKTKLTDYVLLLNNDTIVSPDFIDGLISKFNESDDTGFVGIKHYYYHERNKLQTVGGGIVDLVHGEAMAVFDDTRDSFDFITGSCIFTSVDVLDEVGTMNEDFFMYWEDVDWSSCVCEHGYKLRISNRGCIYHKEGASIKSLSRLYYHMRNRIFYMKRHTSGLIYYKFIIYIVLFALKEFF
ncbi:hypothetical protein A9758_02925, partial [Methanosphaera sp. A6]